MKLANFGIIAAILFAIGVSPTTSARELSRANDGHQTQRAESNHSRHYRNNNYQRKRYTARRHHRSVNNRSHSQRRTTRHSYAGFGHRSHWRGYKRRHHTSHYSAPRPHHYRTRNGHSRIVIRHNISGHSAPALAGGIIGGVLAHEVSGGDQGATFVGAILGAAIASDSHNRRHQR